MRNSNIERKLEPTGNVVKEEIWLRKTKNIAPNPEVMIIAVFLKTQR